MKATSLFGGVQVFNIILHIIRSKVIAILLGPTGMGILGLLISTTGLITSLTNFGLGTSAVKIIAEANELGNAKRINHITAVFKRLVWLTGLMGLLITLCLSPWLSLITFGNKDYTLAFVWLSISLLFAQLNSGQLVILQGTRHLKQLAKANVFGSALGLIVTLPLYYFYRIDGLVPGIIGTSMVTMLVSWYFSSKIKFEKITINRKETFSEGKEMIIMGILISLSGLMTAGGSFLIRIFINSVGGVDQVGLYSAGFAIINTYVGLVFTAMSTDYYPRLSAISHNNEKCKQTINQQAEITILILSPIIIVFLIFINVVITLLYSKEFIPINGMIYWAAIGMFFKAASWSIGFIILAKGDGKVYFLSELASNCYMLIFNIIGYYIWGLTGLGISFVLGYLFFWIQVFLISNYRYSFSYSFSKAFWKIFILQFSLAILGFLTINFLKTTISYGIGIILIAISSWYSLNELYQRIGGFRSLLPTNQKSNHL